ncbi:hypothetical protein [Sphaerimonospora thailandensis]|uniref:hypothetical protein n=1 Tax=Sphaerimonospora thailandensis TaxID=795644 RepID=UPI001950318C|nr:hypothetical protein [Sphaerimonospora thailandensis]
MPQRIDVVAFPAAAGRIGTHEIDGRSGTSLADIEAHYRDLIERSPHIGEMCLTWCRAPSADQVIQALEVEVLDVTVGDLQGLINESYDDPEEGIVGRFLLLAEEPPWFLAVEYSGDRAFGGT